MDGLKIILSEQVEGAEELVVFQVEGPGSLEVALESNRGRGLYDELLWCSDLTVELLLVLGGRDARGSPRSAPMVVVGVAVTVVQVMGVVVEEL